MGIDTISALILASSLVIIMFGMGLSLTIADFRQIFLQPKAIFIGLANQLLLLPVIGYLLAVSLSLKPEIAVGLMILTACPGGATSNLITHLAKGDTALSVSLTAISSLITIITIPIIVQFALHTFLSQQTEIVLNVPSMFGQLMAIIVIPIGLGMLIRIRAQSFAFKMDKPVRIASAIVFAVVVLGLIVKERENILSYFQAAGLVSVVLNLTTMAIGFFSAFLAKLSRRQAISISIESGVQNGTLAITIATVSLGNTELGIVGAIYSLVMFLASFFVIIFARR